MSSAGHRASDRRRDKRRHSSSFQRPRDVGCDNDPFQNLKHYAEDTEGLVTGSMLYDRHLMQPLFRLSIGNPGQLFRSRDSAARPGCRRGYRRGRRDCRSDYCNLDKYLLDINRDKRYWEKQARSYPQARKRARGHSRTLSRRGETLRRSRRGHPCRSPRRGNADIEGSNGAIERAISEIRHAQAERDRHPRSAPSAPRQKGASARVVEASRTAAQGAEAKKERAKSPTAVQTAKAPVEVGSTVRLDGQGTPGRVIEISGKNAVVAFGMIKTTVSSIASAAYQRKIPRHRLKAQDSYRRPLPTHEAPSAPVQSRYRRARDEGRRGNSGCHLFPRRCNTVFRPDASESFTERGREHCVRLSGLIWQQWPEFRISPTRCAPGGAGITVVDLD